MSHIINPKCVCQECGDFTGSALRAYCSLKCRDKAKWKRRKSGEAVSGPASSSQMSDSERSSRIEYPDSDLASLDLISASLLAGEASPVWFPEVDPACLWQAPDGIHWEIIGTWGKMEKEQTRSV